MLVEEGKTVAINTVVARIDESGGNGASAPRQPRPSQPRTAAGRGRPARLLLRRLLLRPKHPNCSA